MEDDELALKIEILAEDIDPSWGIISPDNSIKGIWDLIVLFLVIFQAFVVPFRLCFGTVNTPNEDIFDVIVDIMFMVDIVASFNTSVS